MSGKLIVFEGGEGCGKTTQVQRLYTWLNQSESLQLLKTQNRIAGIKLTREPGGTAVGKKIRQLLLQDEPAEAGDQADAPILSKAELLLYAADRAQHIEETLRPWLESGYWVVCDRYTDSTVAYQGYGRQLDLSLIDRLNKIATGGLKSDLTLLLNVSLDVGLARMRQRGDADRIEQASREFHQRVNSGFAALAADSRDDSLSGGISSGPIIEIDGNLSIEAVSSDIQKVVSDRLAQWYSELSLKL
ncbi:MAG: dTMP kinase [Phormidesmis sp.]